MGAFGVGDRQRSLDIEMRFGIYIYVDGSDLWEVVDTIKDGIAEHVANKDHRIKLIDDRYPKSEDMGEDDLPDWNLGVNFKLEELEAYEIEELMIFFQNLSIKTARDFAVGYYDNMTHIDEDIGFIEKNKTVDDIVRIIEDMK